MSRSSSLHSNAGGEHMEDKIALLSRRLEREREARKAAEKLLEEKSSEIYEVNKRLAQVALFVDLSPHPIMRFNATGQLVLANGAAWNYLGEGFETGGSLTDILPALKDVCLKTIIEGNEILQVATLIGERYFQFVFHGVAEQGFANVYASDITQQELAKKQTEYAHRETEQLLSAISSILVGVDRNNKVARWNRMAEQTFGLPAASVLGHPLESCNIPWKLDALEKLVKESKSRDYAHASDVVYTNPEGKERFLNVHINVVRDGEGAFNGYLILAADITERKVLEGQLIQSQKLESLGQLAAGIAHEINTPIQFIGDNTRFLGVAFERLNAVIEKSQSLMKELTEGSGHLGEVIVEMEDAVKKAKIQYMTEEIPSAIQETLGGVDQVASIVRAMKQFSHPGAKHKTLSNLNESVNSTINVARNEWKYRADLETDLAEDMPPVPCNQSEINQVLLNMIVNSTHAIEEKYNGSNQKGKIIIRTRVNGPWAEIHVSDDGAGIPEKVKTKIFDPFFTTKEVGKGSGQGLSLAYSVIYETHKGNIEVSSVQGEGTTFIIRLPLKAVEEVAA